MNPAGALRELLRGLQAAGDLRGLAPDELRAGLVATVLRLVFLRLAGDLLPRPEPRDDAWRAHLARVRAVHAAHGGRLFDPAAHPVLERVAVPADALARAQDHLSAETCDIEQLGAAYESTLDLALERDEAGALGLRPGSDRRRSGSHYTPRALTGPIVAATLQPALAALGDDPTPAQLLGLTICDPAMGGGAFLLEAGRQLAEHLARAWARRGESPDSTRSHALRQLAAHCLYGVDVDPIAVELARLSLWLLTRASDRPFTIFDHALKRGDSLVGRARGSIAACALRAPPVPPFDWPLEFPAVFAGDDPGFDCVVGNPPFLAGGRISSTLGPAYLAWLKHVHEDSHGNADLVAHFFRRAFALLRRGGTFGLIATNTIAQGDTRATGLRWICRHGGHIVRAERRAAWPGEAAVVVSIVHVRRGPPCGEVVLDGRPVARISAFLAHAGDDDDPAPLRANAGLAFLGSKIYGQGFLFADGVAGATPLAEMRRLVAADPRNAARIAPYIGGEEVNASPTHAHRRHVIDFGDMSEEQARQWPDLMAIVEARVRPQRQRQNRPARARRWWRFGETAPGLLAAIRGLPRVLVLSRVSRSLAFTFLAPGPVFSEQLVVFALPQFAALALLQSRVHEVWARTFGSSMKDDLRYTPSDCFDTFPLPPGFPQPELEALGRAYHEQRAALLVARGEGLTALYNRFHDPREQDPALLRLRELHAAIDGAVLRSYEWSDLAARATCEFHRGGDGRARRYGWPAAVGDEVLARLLALGRRRATAGRSSS